MSDRVPPGCVWLCRDDVCDRIGHVRLWFVQPLMRVTDDHGPGVGAKTYWADMGTMRSDDASRLFGDLPEPNEARLVDRTRNEWLCPKCEKWYSRRANGLWCPIHGDVALTKSRAYVVRTIPLEVA